MPVDNFLTETEPLIDNLESLAYSTATELYDMLETVAKYVSVNMKLFDPEMRVELCKRLDNVLGHIIDTMPSGVSYDVTGVYTPAVQNYYRHWSNEELLKDKGLVGYTLAKAVGAEPVMYFANQDCKYLDYLPGLKILQNTSPQINDDEYFEHFQKEFPKMDVLILHGIYSKTPEFLRVYRALRPDGKVYCGLDMNSGWIKNTQWTHPAVLMHSEQCDIVATSCRAIRDELNRNPETRFPCRWFPNGFYNANGEEIKADARYKKNIILTVGRIGNLEKNNIELMLAFAKAAHILPDWTLRLVGPIEPEFQTVINEYFDALPQLKNRVIFTGAIANKAALYSEYAQAKIFALTSLIEGGTPNVYAEALFHGCMFITSDIDAADDVTNNGELGIKYKLKDVNALAAGLVKLAKKSDEAEMQKHIDKALTYAKKYYDWERNARKLAYMLFR